ncbi:hypothetical protein SAMN05444161_6710 [Rhizobiales bacterium GAS191]|nr:hypothetical protein SAMN05444161_6710 [Rhizobiales bacterium GAS191]
MRRSCVVRQILIAGSTALAFAASGIVFPAQAGAANYLPGVNVQGGNAIVGAQLAPGGGVNVQGGNAIVGAELAPGGGVQVGPVRPLQVPAGVVPPVPTFPSISGLYPSTCTPMHLAAGQCRPGHL